MRLRVRVVLETLALFQWRVEIEDGEPLLESVISQVTSAAKVSRGDGGSMRVTREGSQ